MIFPGTGMNYLTLKMIFQSLRLKNKMYTIKFFLIFFFVGYHAV